MIDKVWYVALADDSFQVGEGIWAHDGEFFSCETKAFEACSRLNNDELVRYANNKERTYEKWELTNIAYEAMKNIDMDVEKVFPYHKYNEFNHYDFKPVYEVRSIEVIR